MHVHSEIVRTIARNCAAFGVAEEAVYRQAGITPEILAVADGMVDWKIGIRMWESALELTRYRYISLNFGKNITFSVLGWIAPVTASSRNLAMAWRSFADFFPLMGDMFSYEVEEGTNGTVVVRYEPNPVWQEASPLTAALAAEHAMSLTLSLSGYLCGRIVFPLLARFGHKVPKEEEALFRSQFGQVQFGAPQYELVFDAATAALPLVSANTLLYDNMRSLCLEKLRQLEQQTGVSSRVLQLMTQKQAYYAPRLEDVAAMLGLSPRTLQRKLREEGRTFQELLEEHQIELASQLLRRPDVRVQEVAFQLGFNSLQSFSRAFKRKTGRTPSEVQRLLGPNPVAE
ncbi:AraC family transcriptional regulator ligand-binding domain-containing protein [Tellurirhabdus rosea]|uniref:AraC family transcriptional regulator ligand-binding domain-containing protein n=1 Tax=Tellurirhabdus rosea TaxID=2674997 RepID=UPI002250EB80|nr:AraC family transcriptional regulator [Tellurirhabdus rosea]